MVEKQGDDDVGMSVGLGKGRIDTLCGQISSDLSGRVESLGACPVSVLLVGPDPVAQRENQARSDCLTSQSDRTKSRSGPCPTLL